MRKLLLLVFLLVSRIGLSQTWGTLDADVAITMNTSTPGAAFTTTIGNAGTVSNMCTVGNSNCTFSGTVTGLTVGANQGVGSNLGPVQMNGGGPLYPPQSLNYSNIQHNDNDNGTLGVIMNFGSGASSHYTTLTGLFTSGLPYQDGGYDSDVIMMLDSQGDQYFDMQLEDRCGGPTGVYGMNLENRAIAHTTCIVIPAQSSFYFSLAWDITNGVGTLFMFTPQGTLIGSSYLAESTNLPYGETRVFSNEGASNSGTFSEYQNMMQTWSVSPPSGTATFTNGSTTVTWASGNPFVAGTQWGQSGWGGYFYVGAANGCSSAPCAAVMNPIGYCPSTTTCTLSTAYTGTTGTYAWTAELPLFWPQTDVWAGILPPARGTEWNQAGVVGGIPSASWPICSTTACNTLTSAGASATLAQIQAAMASVSGGAGSVVLLPAGNYSTAGICLKGYSNVVLRGSGANQTIITPTGAASGCGSTGAALGLVGNDSNDGGSPNNLTTIGGMLNQGSQTVTLASGGNFVVGNYIIFDQLDSTTDEGGILVLGTSDTYTGSYTAPGNAGPYTTEGGGSNGGQGARATSCSSSEPANCYHQQHYAVITSCKGVTTAGTSCSGSNVVVGFFPPLAMTNWSSGASPSAWGPTSPSSYVGVEDLTINAANVTGGQCGGQTGIGIQNVVNGWVKGVAVLNTNQSHIQTRDSAHISIVNNYLFGTEYASTCSYGTESLGAGYELIENNIAHAIASPWIKSGPQMGSVYGYNFTVNSYFASASYNQNGEGDHTPGADTTLMEGNITNWSTGDDIHGTGNLQTYFRNLFYGAQPKCYSSGSSYATAVYGSCSNPTNAMQWTAYHRFYSAIGNVLQNVNASTTYGTAASGTSMVVQLGLFNNSSVNADPNVTTTEMFWDNADNVTGFGSPRQDCSELQTFPGSATVYTSVVVPHFNLSVQCPATSATLPASFYHSSTPSWWPSGKPWPLIGPGVTGGNLLVCSGGTQSGALVTSSTQCTGGTTSTAFSGLVNSNPAMDCYLNTMSGPANGVTTGALSFNESSCYVSSSGGGLPSPPTGLTASVN